MAVAAFLAFEPASFAIIRRHDRDDAKYLQLGAKYPACTRVGGGSGTLIAPQWIITAGHVANNFSPFQRSVSFNGKRYAIDAVITHPQWKRKSGLASVDIALLHLDKPVFGITGMFGDGQRGPVGDDGKLRGATNTVADAQERWLTFSFDAPPNGTDLEGIGGPGDSGGPAIMLVDRKPYVIAKAFFDAYAANDDASMSRFEQAYRADAALKKSRSTNVWKRGVSSTASGARSNPRNSRKRLMAASSSSRTPTPRTSGKSSSSSSTRASHTS